MLGKRVFFGAVGVLIIILMFLIGEWFFDFVVLAAALIGSLEFYASFKHKGYKPLIIVGLTAIVLFYLQRLYFDGIYDLISIIIIMMFVLSIPVFSKTASLLDSAITFMGIFYPGILLYLVIILKDRIVLYDNYLLILVLFSTFSTDIFAYFIGEKFGRRKLCPSISPNKTIEGSIGGILGSVIVTIITGIILNNIFTQQMSFVHFVFIGLLCGIFSQVGDLTASSIKRYTGIKDFGKIIPGHGGILDRLDSLLYTVPVIYIYYLLFLAG